MQIHSEIAGAVKSANYLHENIFMPRRLEAAGQLPEKSHNLPLGVCGAHFAPRGVVAPANLQLPVVPIGSAGNKELRGTETRLIKTISFL